MTNPDTRAFEFTIDIAVSPDAVWQALTDAEELVRWFPLEAQITPGAGGKWLIGWEGQWSWGTEIEIWEPARHLRLVDRAGRPYDAEGKPRSEVAPMPVAIDWFLDAKGGSTTLRLVHSGFGRGAEWDDEFDGVSLGWQLELHGLKHYLERHRGERRHVAWNRARMSVPPATAWERLMSREGLIADRSLLALKPGERYTARLSTGDVFEGTVILNARGRGVQMTVDGWNHALYRLWVDPAKGQSAVNSWLTAYDVPRERIKDFDARMRNEMERIAATAVV